MREHSLSFLIYIFKKRIMKLKQILHETYGDYKECSMLLIADNCINKCEGCHNQHLLQLESKIFPDEEIIKRFVENPLSKAIIFGGLEPMDQAEEVEKFIFTAINMGIACPIIIYTSYNPLSYVFRCSNVMEAIKQYLGKVIIKHGPYKKDLKPVFNEDLGVTLASSNQYTIVYE